MGVRYVERQWGVKTIEDNRARIKHEVLRDKNIDRPGALKSGQETRGFDDGRVTLTKGKENDRWNETGYRRRKSSRAFWSIVSLTAEKTSRIFVVSVA